MRTTKIGVLSTGESAVALGVGRGRVWCRGAGLRVLCVFVCVFVALLVGCVSAQATVGMIPKLTFFQSPVPAPEPAPTETLGGIGADDATHEVYVDDLDSARVLQFGGLGSFSAAFGSGVDLTTGGAVCTAVSGDACGQGNGSEGPGGIQGAAGLAVDQLTSDVYVGERNKNRVEKFTANGEPMLMFGKDVNKSGGDVCSASEAAQCQKGTQLMAGEGGVGFHDWGNGRPTEGHIAVGGSGTVYVGDENRVEQFGPEGVYAGEVALPGEGIVYGLAVDGSGDLYVIGDHSAGVEEFSPAGVKLAVLGSAAGEPVDVAIGPGGDVFVLELAGGERVTQYSPSGTLVAETPAGSFIKEPAGFNNDALAVTPEGTVYVTNGLREKPDFTLKGEVGVEVFGSPPLLAPTVGNSGVAKLGVREAEVEVRADPNLLPTSFRVEYGLTEAYGSVAEGGLVGENLAEDRVTVRLDGLEPGLTYHYRVVAESRGGATYGADHVLKTFPSPFARLPDGRMYELVSESLKFGHQSGGGSTQAPEVGYGVARPDGSGLLYATEVAQGASETGIQTFAVARDGTNGWSSASAVPQGHTPIGNPELGRVLSVLPSVDLEHIVFHSYKRPFYSGSEIDPSAQAANVYRVGTFGGVEEPEWLSEPRVANALPELAAGGTPGVAIVGGSPSLEAVFFGYSGTLLREDNSRRPYVGTGTEPDKPWGFYEWDGRAPAGSQLVSAGVLPTTGRPSPWGAVPADIAGNESEVPSPSREEALSPGTAANDVAVDGSRPDALFVSPDPDSVGLCKTEEEAAGRSAQKIKEVCTPQLYLREGDERTVLVSKSMLTGDQASDGPLAVLAASGTAGESRHVHGSQFETVGYGFQSEDGSRVFFQSVDRLTSEAPENGEAKEYVFDVETETVSYVPGVVGSVIAASPDGSQVVFLARALSGGGVLWLWSGGVVSEIAQLPPVTGGLFVSAGRVVGSGPVVVFQTRSAIPGFNDGGGYQEVFRWSPSEGLACVSCAPAGVAPSGESYLSHDAEEKYFVVENDGVSEDGSRVFFDTPSPLVAAAVNGVSDVYEWENGHVYLVSGGRSPYPTFFIDSSANGDDVFFATAEGLVPGDTDGGYDVYDARVGGHAPVQPEPQCTSGCRGTGEGTSGPLSGFTGVSGPSGNVLGAPAPVSVAPSKAAPGRAKKVARCPKGKRRSRGKCVKVKSVKRKAKGKKSSSASARGRVGR